MDDGQMDGRTEVDGDEQCEHRYTVYDTSGVRGMSPKWVEVECSFVFVDGSSGHLFHFGLPCRVLCHSPTCGDIFSCECLS